MKALSVWQPWASFFFYPEHPWGAKVVENRSWPTRYRGPLLIHASKKFDRDCLLSLAVNIDPFPDTPLGVLLGIVDLVGCDRAMKTAWDVEGQWHWRVTGAVKFKRPILWRGAQGLFEVPKHIISGSLRETA